MASEKITGKEVEKRGCRRTWGTALLFKLLLLHLRYCPALWVTAPALEVLPCSLSYCSCTWGTALLFELLLLHLRYCPALWVTVLALEVLPWCLSYCSCTSGTALLFELLFLHLKYWPGTCGRPVVPVLQAMSHDLLWESEKNQEKFRITCSRAKIWTRDLPDTKNFCPFSRDMQQCNH